MGANDANGKIYISAEVIDNFKQLASQVKGGLSQVAKEAKLEIEVDDKDTQRAIESTLKNINNYLGKSKFKKIDFSEVLMPLNDLLGDTKIKGSEKLEILDGLDTTLYNIDRFSNGIHQKFIESLDADGVKQYFKQLNSIVDYLSDNFSSNYEKMFNFFATDEGFDYNFLFTLDSLNKGKYGYLVEDFFGEPEDLKKQLEKEFRHYMSTGLSDAEYSMSLEKVAGLTSSLETMLNDSIINIMDSNGLGKNIKQALNSVTKDYGVAVANSIKKTMLDVSNMILDGDDLLVDIEDGKIPYNINSILNTDTYDNRILDKIFNRKVKQQKVPSAKDIINETIKGEGEPTDYSYIYDNEAEAAERLKNKIEEVHKAIDDKTSALDTEADKMSEIVASEIRDIDKLNKKIKNKSVNDYINTALQTDEKGELYTVYRLIANTPNAKNSNKDIYAGTSFGNTNYDMTRGATKGATAKKIYKYNFKANNPLVLDARGRSYSNLPTDIIGGYEGSTQYLLNVKKKEIEALEKELSDINRNIGINLELDDGDIINGSAGDILQSTEDIKNYLEETLKGVINNEEEKNAIITDAIKQIKEIQKKAKEKQKDLQAIIDNDTLPQWKDLTDSRGNPIKLDKDGTGRFLDNDILARWLQGQDYYDAIILQNVEDIPIDGGNWAEGINVILKDAVNQMANVSLAEASGKDAYLKTVEEEVVSVYSKVEEKIDSIISKLDGIKFPVNLIPEVMVDKGSLSEIVDNDKFEIPDEILADDFDYEEIEPLDELKSYVQDFIENIKSSMKWNYLEDIIREWGDDADGAKSHGVYNSKFIKSNGGHQNKGIYQDEKITAILREEEYEGKIKALMPVLDEAYKKGANVARILDYIVDKDEEVLVEIQETAAGHLIGGDDDDQEWLKATDEQILKLISDFKILQEEGLYFDVGGENLLYDKDKGFSIIDLAVPKDKNHIPSYNSNDPLDLIDYLGKYGSNSSYGAAPSFKDKLTKGIKLSNSIASVEKNWKMGFISEKEMEETIKQLKEEAGFYIESASELIDDEVNEILESKKQIFQRAIYSIESGHVLVGDDGAFEGHDLEGLEESFKTIVNGINKGTDFPSDLMDYYHEIAQKVVTSANEFAEILLEDLDYDEEEFEYDDAFEAKEKFQEAVKIINSLSEDDYNNNYGGHIGLSLDGLKSWFTSEGIENIDFSDKESYSDFLEIAQEIIDKYNSLNKNSLDKKEKIKEAAKILDSLDIDDYYDNYFDDVEEPFSSLNYQFSRIGKSDENEFDIPKLSEYAQKIIDKYNSLNKTTFVTDTKSSLDEETFDTSEALNALATTIDNEVDDVLESKKKKIKEAAKILGSLSMVDYHDNYFDDVEQDYYDLVYDFGNMDLYDEDGISELSEHAQKIIDKYNLLNKTVIKESSDTLSEIEKTVPGIGDLAKALHSKVLTSDEIDGVLSGGTKGTDPWAKKPSWLKPHPSFSKKEEEKKFDEALLEAKEEYKSIEAPIASATEKKEEFIEANKELAEVTSSTLEKLEAEEITFMNLGDNAHFAAEKKEEFAQAESSIYDATNKTADLLDDEDDVFRSITQFISDATDALNNFSTAHDNINQLGDINVKISASTDNNTNNNQRSTQSSNKKTAPYTSLEQISNEDIIKNYEDIGGALPNIVNKNLRDNINKLDTPSFEDLLDEGYQNYRQSLIKMFESMSEDDLISEYGNVIGENLNKSITTSVAKGIDSIDFENTSDILLSKLMEEQREINEAEENFINNINSVESQYSKLSESKSFYTGSDTSIFDLKKYSDKKIDPKGRIKETSILSKELSKVKKELNSEFDDEGKIAGKVDENRIKHIQELINKYNDLINKIKQLKDIIKAPDSIENTQLNLKKQAEAIQKASQSGKYEKFNKQILDTINKYSYYDTEGNITGQTASQINELKKELENYNTIIEKIKTANTDQEFVKLGEEAKEAQEKIKELTEDLKEMSSPVATKNQTTSLAKQISGFMDKNTRISVEARSELQSYFNTLMSGASVGSDALSNMTQRFKEIKIAEEQAGRLGGDIFSQMVGKMREGIAYLTTKVSAYEIFNQFRQGFEIIHQFDDALTEMMKVSDETRASLERYQKTTFETADAIGTSALQIQNSTADFMRLGETLDQAAESAKSANVLMNVSEFQNIDEATKSLIAMGAAYNDLSKMNIIDKLNEVGNNYAISTSEAATALQSSASALKTAGNDMDEALALVTAGNAVVQDANKVGTGMRTIALRLTGTKSAKEELEEMGEETENVITSQSKLRDTIKQATAVASNGFKGFDILDDNGNYKSTYEIMLGIADVYNEILATDKQFGRNNANLLLESVAGKNRANIAASIFQNPQLLRDAYQSSQEANGSAMRENDKYVQSISGHLAQLTNAWQQMWANAANREVINFFIDGAKTIINFANAIGILPSTFALILPYIEIITRAKSGKGIISSFLEWANGLNEVKKATEGVAKTQEGLNAIEETATTINTARIASEEAKTAATIEATGAELAESAADTTGIASSVAKTASNEAETLSVEEQALAYVQLGMAEEAEQVAESGGIFAKASGGINLLKGAFTGLVSTIGAVPLAIGAATVVLFAAKKAYDAHRESVFADAKATAENIKTQQEATSQQIESYKQLKAQLDSGDLSEQETINVKQQILDIQKSITEQYGTAAQGVDLINGKLEEQVGLLDSISQKEAQDQYFKDYEGFQVAEQEYSKNNRSYNIGLNNTGNANLDKAITDELLKNGFRIQAAGMGTFNASVKGTASDGINALENTKKALEELKAEYRDRDTLEALNKQIAKIEEQIGKAYEVVDKYEATALRGLELDLAGNDTNGYDIYKNYQSSVSNLEDAYITGDTQKINEARKAFDEATKAKNDFLEVGDNGQFALLFNKIDTSLINAKNRFRDTVELFKDIPEPEEKEGLFGKDSDKIYKKTAKAESKVVKETNKAYKAAKKLYSLNPDKVDIQATLQNNTYASGKYADALNTLMKEMGWTTADADDLINALITAGIVHGDAADVAYMASDSYNTFSSSVENTIGVLNTLNTALTESAKGTGLTEQTLTELRAAFGDNLNSVLEKTANGYHLNTQGAYLLRQEQEAMVNANYASSMYEQYQALDKLQEGFVKAKAAGEDTSGYIQQRQAIQNNIDKINEQLMAFNNANSAYQTWLAKQNSEGEREMYNSVYSGYDAVKDELERGWAGEKSRSWVDLIFNDENEDWDAWTAPAELINEKVKEVTKKIEGTGGFSIGDFFTVDANGKTTSQGVWNFFEAIQNKQKEVGKEFVNLEEDWFDFTENGDYQIAEMLGMDIESVHSILRAAADAGFEIHLDQPLFSLEQLEEKAISAKEALEETTGTKLKINLDPQSEDDVDDAMQKLLEYQQSLAEDTSLEPKVKTERLQYVADLLNYMAAKKREFVEGELFDFVDTRKLTESQKRITQLTNTISSSFSKMGRFDLASKFSIDPTQISNVDYLKDLIQTIKDTTIDPSIDSSQITILNQLLEEAQNRLDYLEGTNNTTATVSQLMAAQEIATNVNEKLDYAAQHSNINFDWSVDQEFIQYLDVLANLPTELKYAFGIDPDATTEDLLELAQKGELHINIEATGNVPKDTNTTNTTTNETFNTTHNTIDTVLTVETEGTGAIYQTEQALQEVAGNDWEAYLQAHTEEANQKIDETNQKKEEFGSTDTEANANVDNTQGNNAIDDLMSKGKNFNGSSWWGYANLGGNAIDKLNTIDDLLDGLTTYKSITVETFEKTTHLANGTAHVHGTAFSKGSAYTGGKWGLPNDQTALTGELGTEIVVRDGNWFTVGEDGAEFVNLKKGDIVFNHKQAQELLENGYVTSNKGRGHLVGFANGTAYSYGSSSGALRPSKTSTGMGGSSRSSSGGSGGSGGSSGNSSSNNAKETKNTLDEVEILIGRIEARISDLDKIIGSTYNTWEDRNDSILDNLKLVTQEISDQRKAYTTYMNKANSVGLSESWKQKIRDGAFRIEDVTDSDLWDKIQEYQTYYNKAVASEQALIDLTNKRGELYKQLFDNTQTYYDNMVEAIQHEIDVQDTFIDRLEEAGRLSSKILIYRQYDQEQRKLVKLNEELQTLRQREKDALNSGYIEYGSEAWSEMEAAIADVCASIEEAENNLVSYDKALNEVDWNRWDRIHDSIDGVVNELEFIYDLMNEDDLFNEQGDITDQGTTALALLAHEYDVYFAEVQEYQKEINQVQEDLAKDPYNQTLVDKLKELKEAQQDAASGAKKMKESIVDVTEKGIKKQIDYVKKLIEDYEELLETQKDQIDYAKKVADQQKELNKLEKQYRAIQNDNSEEGATKRQQLRNQIEEARQNLKDTQDDRRLSETKDMLSKFEENLEDFLDNKLKDIEGTVREAINTANTNRDIIKDTINNLTSSYGYSPSDTLKSTLDDMNRSFVSYFDRQFENNDVASIADNVNKIVDYYQRVQSQSNQEATIDTMTEAVRHDGNIQTYRDENGNTVTGYFRSDGTRDETYTGWAEKAGKQYRFENGQQLTGSQFITVGGQQYHLDESGAVQKGWQKINDKWYYMNSQGQIQTGWQKINDKWYYMNSQGQMQTGAQTINGKTYVMDESGAMLSGGWKKSGGKWYYLNDNGVAKTGWIKDKNKWYYLNSQGAMLTGAQSIGGKTYVMDESGAMLSSGWYKSNGKWYYLNSNGSAKTGWFKDNGKWYLFDNQGAMRTGFYTESGKTYYMDGSGAMLTGWQKINGQWYYFNSKGQAASGWAELTWGNNTDWYYFDPKTKAMITNAWIDKGGVTTNPQKGAYYVGNSGAMVKDGRRSTNKGWLTFEKDGKWTGYKTGTSGVKTNGLYWTNEGNKVEAIIRKSDGAILTPLSKGDSVIPNSAMKNMYQALTDPAKYLKQYTTPDVRVIQSNNNTNGQPPIVNMQFIANGVQDANRFVNDLMNNKKLEKWVQEVTLGQANGNNNYKKYSYVIR